MADEIEPIVEVPETAITMVVKKENLEAAKKLFRALDPDRGGYESFGTEMKNGSFMASMPASPELISLFKDLLANEDKMQAYLQEDFEKRWKPTDEEKEAAKTNPILAEKQKIATKEELAASFSTALIDSQSFKEVVEEKAKEGIILEIQDPKVSAAIEEPVKIVKD